MSCLRLVQGDFVKRVYLKMNLTVKNKALGKLIRKIVVGKVLPNMFFFCLGLAKIVFQLDAVKFAMLFWVSRLEKQVIRCVAFAKCKGNLYLFVMARKSVLNKINGFNHNNFFKEHHIRDLTSLYIGAFFSFSVY